MTSLQLTRPIAFIDIETTGLNRNEDRIVDLCIIKILPGGQEEILKSLVNPTIPIPSDSTEIHGIVDADVQGKPTFKDLAQKIVKFLDNCDLGGYGVKFDLAIIGSELKRVGINYSNEGRNVIDVMDIYFKLEPRDLVAAYSRYCGKDLDGAHRSENDIKATIEVLEAQIEKYELPKDISSLNEFCNPKDPSWVDNDGKIKWRDGKATINFGAHMGKSLEYMQINEVGYLQWILRGDFSSEVKDIIRESINGRFPKEVHSTDKSTTS
jgi:DNA polymerase III subunit epsilon